MNVRFVIAIGLLLTVHSYALGRNYDLLIRNARIVDGSGTAWYRGDIAVLDGKIAAIGVLDADATAPAALDAKDQYAAPGFIDVHTHCEGDLLSQPEAQNFVRMGVTTIITGNCGGSYANLREAFTSHSQEGIGVNMASLVGHGTVRQRVMGNVNRDPSTTEIEAMQNLVSQGMRDGAVGLSTGLIYTPGIWSKTPELIALAKAAGERHGVYASHMRSEGNDIFKAIDEALEIGRESGCPVEISHFKVSAPTRHGQSTQTIERVEKARAAGQDVTVDQYVYTASSTGLGSILPNWAVEGSSETVRARFADPDQRKKIVDELIRERRDQGRPNMDYAVVASFRADSSLNGKSILAIAKEKRHSDSWEAQAETVMDLMTSGGAGMVYHSMAENDVQNILKYPHSMFASDSGVRRFGQGVPHPRGYGNNARVLSKYVRTLKLISLEEAVRKMTSLPAARFSFMDRGLLRPGMAADIVVFDLDKVNDPATFEKPHAYAEGFEQVLVNGEPVILDGQMTHRMPGAILTGPKTDITYPKPSKVHAPEKEEDRKTERTRET